MKKILFVLALCFGMQFQSNAQFTFGAGAHYIFNGSSFGFQGKGIIGLNEKFDIAPSVGIILDSGTPLTFDADLHYNLLHIGDDFRLFPFAGLNFVTGNGSSELGLNFGASIRFDINENTVYIEPKLTLLTYDGLAIGAGLLF